MTTIWEEEFMIRFHDVDLHGNCKIQQIFNMMSESCWSHAEHLGIGFSFMKKLGLIWAYARKKLEINRYPQWGETVTVRTWPSGVDRLYFHREFQVVDQNGDILINCSALYFPFNREEQRPISPYGISAALSHTYNVHTTTGSVTKIKPFGVNEMDTYPYEVDYSDLDLHGHVNNLSYIDWIMHNLPTEFRQKHVLNNLSVNYFAEARDGDELLINISEKLDNRRYRHSVVRKSDNKELFRAETQWEKIAQPLFVAGRSHANRNAKDKVGTVTEKELVAA